MTSANTLPTVAVVSVTYNRCEPLLVLLRQLGALDYDLAQLDIYLVDNASTDGTAARVRAEFPHVHLIESAENTGVAAGFNRSVEAALAGARPYRYLWLLDSDAEVEPATLMRMVSAMEDDARIGIVGSAVYDPQARTRLVTAGLRVDWRRADLPYVLPNADGGPRLLDVDLVPACSMLTRASLYAEVGMWDLRFPLYWGDTDWCARVLRAGQRVCCAVDSRAWHRDWSSVVRGFGAATFIRDHVRGALLFHLRHDPLGSLAATRRLILKTSVKAALERLTMRHGYARAYAGAVRDLLRGRFPRDFGNTGDEPVPTPLEALVASLAPRLPPRPVILLNQVGDEARRARLRAVFERHIADIQWREIAPQALGDEWSEYRVFHPRQLAQHLLRMARGFGRPDLNVCEVSRPLLYNFLAGRRSLLLDQAERGVLLDNAPFGEGLRCAWMLLRGVVAACIELPLAARRCAPLRVAVADKRGLDEAALEQGATAA